MPYWRQEVRERQAAVRPGCARCACCAPVGRRVPPARRPRRGRCRVLHSRRGFARLVHVFCPLQAPCCVLGAPFPRDSLLILFILIAGVVGLDLFTTPYCCSSMIHRSLFGRAGWGRFSGLVGGAYGRCSTATNDTTPLYDFSYTLQTAADLGAATHGPIKLWGRPCGFRATARATATWAPRVFSRRQA